MKYKNIILREIRKSKNKIRLSDLVKKVTANHVNPKPKYGPPHIEVSRTLRSLIQRDKVRVDALWRLSVVDSKSR